MQTWQSVFLGTRELSREISAFELEAFFTFSGAERQLIEQRRDPSLKPRLALQMGFLRMSGRLLGAFRIVPGNLWRHLGAQFNVEAPDLASLPALYRRGNTLFEQQQLACQALGRMASLGPRLLTWSAFTFRSVCSSLPTSSDSFWTCSFIGTAHEPATPALLCWF